MQRHTDITMNMRHSTPASSAPSLENEFTVSELEAIVIIDTHQRIVMLNPTAQSLFACQDGEALNRDLRRFIPTRICVDEASLDGSDDGKGETPVTLDGMGTLVEGVRADGVAFSARLWAHSMNTAASQPGSQPYVCLTLRPPNPEAHAPPQLATFRSSMLALFDMAPAPTWITENDHIVFANRACLALFGVSDLHDIVGRSLYDLLHRASHAPVRRALANALESAGSIHMLTECIARPDGTHRNVSIAMTALPDHGVTTAQMAITDITKQTLEFESMANSKKQMQALSTALVSAREEERRRIARELHDELGQKLAALKMELSSLVPTLRRRAQDGHIVSLIQMVDETAQSVRRMATELGPLMLEDLGLGPAIETLVRDTERRMGIEIKLDMDEGIDTVHDPVATAAYRIVQEALTNVFRHAQASCAKVALHINDQALSLTVQDDGKGFSEHCAVKEGSRGLRGMRERAQLLGGDFQISVGELGGGAVTVSLPLTHPSPVN